MKMTLALITMLGHAALATSRLERRAMENSGAAPLDPKNISESEFMEKDVHHLAELEQTARASEETARNTYSRVAEVVDAEIERIKRELAALQQQDLLQQDTLTKKQYDNSWTPDYNSKKIDLNSKISAQQDKKRIAANRRDAEISGAKAQRTRDVQASKIEAMKNVAINKPERALQILTSIYQDKRRRDQGKCAQVVGGTACGTVAGAAVAGGLGFLGGDCLGQTGYCMVHCDAPGTDAGQTAAGVLCGEQVGTVGAIGGGVVGCATSMAGSWPTSHGYTSAEQSLIDLMCTSQEARQKFLSFK